MKQLHGLSSYQKKLLERFLQEDSIVKNFYFTGGTALQTAYLHHRYSEDLDFFSEQPIDEQMILELVNAAAKQYHCQVESQVLDSYRFYFFTFPDKQTVKVDFVHYPYRRIKKPEIFEGELRVDSLTDIAVNKILCINQRLEVKDFVDLYFLLKQFSIWDLFVGVKHKFNITVEPYIFASDILAVDQFRTLPKMIEPLTLETLCSFYKDLSLKLGGMVMEE